MTRHRSLVMVSALAAAALMVVGGISLVRVITSGRAAAAARDQAQSLENRAEQDRQRAILEEARTQVDQDPTGTLALLSRLSPGLPGWEQARFIAQEAVDQPLARWSLHIPDLSCVTPLHDGRQVALGTRGGNVWLWDARTHQFRYLGAQGGPVTGISASPDDAQLISIGDDGLGWLWEVASGKSEPFGAKGDPANQVVFLADGTAGVLRDSRSLEIWRLRPMERIDQLMGASWAQPTAFGRALLVRRGEEATLIRGAHDRVTFRLPLDWGNPTASRDGTLVLASNLARGLGRIETHSGKLTVLEGLKDPFFLSHAFLESGAAIALVDRRTFDTWAPGAETATEGRLDCDAIEVRPLTGSRVLFTCDDALEIVDVSSDLHQIIPVHQANHALASPRGDLIFNRADKEHLWVWSLQEQADSEMTFAEPVDYVVNADTGDEPVVFGGGRPSTIFALDGSKRTAAPLAHAAEGLAITAVSPDGQSVAWMEVGSSEVRWLDRGRNQMHHLPAPDVHTLDFSTDSHRLILATSQGARLIDVQTEKVDSIPSAGDIVYAAQVVGSGSVVTVDSQTHQPRVWSADGQPLRSLGGLGEGFTVLTNDGKRLVNGHRSGAVDVWSTSDWSVRTLKTGAHRVVAFLVLPDGSAALQADAEGSLISAPLDGGPEQVVALSGAAYALTASHDSHRVAAIDHLGLVTVVDLRSGATWQLHDPRGPFDSIDYLENPPQWLTTRNNRIRFWADDLPTDPTALLKRIQRLPETVELPAIP
jgi:WD40 repeat protein